MTAIQRSPLVHLQDQLGEAAGRTGGAVALRELPPQAHVDVQIPDAAWSACAQALGVALPRQPNRWVAGDPNAYWLGPGEWLLVGRDGTQAELELRARRALGDAWGAVTDVSDQRTTLELSGPGARDVLEGGCSIDLHPRAFGPGDCAQTLLARVPVLIAQRDASPAYELLVRTTFAAHLASWLLDALVELSCAETSVPDAPERCAPTQGER